MKLLPILSHDVSRAIGGEDKAHRASWVVESAVHLREAVIIHHAENFDGRPVSREFCERFCKITFMPVTIPVKSKTCANLCLAGQPHHVLDNA